MKWLNEQVYYEEQYVVYILYRVNMQYGIGTQLESESHASAPTGLEDHLMSRGV